jgi:hypothetical protein
MRNLHFFVDVTMKIAVFADVTLCSMVDHYRRFGETSLRHNNKRVSILVYPEVEGSTLLLNFCKSQ